MNRNGMPVTVPSLPLVSIQVLEFAASTIGFEPSPPLIEPVSDPLESNLNESFWIPPHKCGMLVNVMFPNEPELDPVINQLLFESGPCISPGPAQAVMTLVVTAG